MTKQSPEDNKVKTFASQDEIKEQAASWLVRLDQGPLSSADTEALREWASRSDFHQRYLAKLARNWDAMGVLEELSVLFPLPDKDYDRHIAAQGQAAQGQADASSTGGWFNWLRPPALAGMAAVFAFTLIWLLPASAPQQQRFVTGVGEQARHTLSDGTVIALNTQSVVNVDYRGANRVITLTSGEAHFDVAKNPDRPFVVYAGEGLVWAVGTAFNVYLNQQSVDVTVTEGRVKVFADVIPAQALPALTVALPADATHIEPFNADNPPDEMLVIAGESLQYRERIEHLAQVEEQALKQKLAWQQGALVFDGETLEQALIEISRYTEQSIIIIDPSIKTTRIGGHFKTDNIDALLLSLSEGFGIEVKRVSANRIHLSARQAKKVKRQ